MKTKYKLFLEAKNEKLTSLEDVKNLPKWITIDTFTPSLGDFGYNYCFSKRLSNLLNVKFHEDWIFPSEYGLNEENIAAFLWDRNIKRDKNWEDILDKLYNILLGLNTELYEVDFALKHLHRQFTSKYDVVCGMVSKFNFDDIYYYILCDSMIGVPSEERERMRKLENKFQSLFKNKSISYVMSPKTMDKLESALKKLNKK